MSQPNTEEREKEVMEMIRIHEQLGTLNSDFGLSTIEYYRQLANEKQTNKYLHTWRSKLEQKTSGN